MKTMFNDFIFQIIHWAAGHVYGGKHTNWDYDKCRCKKEKNSPQ